MRSSLSSCNDGPSYTQTSSQSIPSRLVTRPLPEPIVLILSVPDFEVRGDRLGLGQRYLARLVFPVQAPYQPVKSCPLVAAAVSVTFVPLS